MSFESGSVSFRRFLVVGGTSLTAKEVIDGALPQMLFAREGAIPEEVEYGWSGGDHVLDTELTYGKNVFADCVLLALRIDTDKAPAELVKAYTKQQEAIAAASNPSGFISKAQKRDVKDAVRRKIDDERRTGKFRKTKLVPVLYDTDRSTVYANASGSTWEKLAELFERSFARNLLPMTAGSIARRWAENASFREAYADLRPTQFADGPEGASQAPNYPWIARGAEEKDFLGNEFLLWAWYIAEIGKTAFFIDRSLDLDCAYGQTGKDSIRGDGPDRSLEAYSALAVGKVPRKAHLLIYHQMESFEFTLNPEVMAFGSAVLPEKDDAQTPRVLFEERIVLLATLIEITNGMFIEFMRLRVSEDWQGSVDGIRKWIQRRAGVQKRTEELAAIEALPAKMPQKANVRTSDGRHITPDEMVDEIKTKFSGNGSNQSIVMASR
jgi:hypothetical protein